MDISGKTAIVTGGAQGIGESISLALLEQRCKVCICDINEDKGSKLASNLRLLKHDVIFQKCDVSVFDSFNDIFEKTKEVFGKVDILVNNAGIINERNWRNAIEINFVGVIHGIQLAFKHMGRNNGGVGGCVINVASRAGLVGIPLLPIYSSTKHAIVGLTRSFGSDYHFNKTGVSVSCVCPKATDTEMFRMSPGQSVNVTEANKWLKEIVPMQPRMIADSVMELVKAGKNGALLNIDQNGFEYV